MPSLNTWMTGLSNARTLNELCLRASHDAGVYEDKDNGVKPGPSTQCQFSTIFNQALCGSRVFDIRCFLRTAGIINKTKTPTMGHFFKEGKDGYFGDYGGTLMAALDDAATFLKVYPSEFIIFRIGHTKCTGSVADALQQFEATKDSGNQPKFANIIFKGANVNLVNLTVQQLRGKLLLVFDKDFHDPTTFKTSNGYYPYTKWPKVPNIGLCFCGLIGIGYDWHGRNDRVQVVHPARLLTRSGTLDAMPELRHRDWPS